MMTSEKVGDLMVKNTRSSVEAATKGYSSTAFPKWHAVNSSARSDVFREKSRDLAEKSSVIHNLLSYQRNSLTRSMKSIKPKGLQCFPTCI